jgi:hypothetical protein
MEIEPSTSIPSTPKAIGRSIVPALLVKVRALIFSPPEEPWRTL